MMFKLNFKIEKVAHGALALMVFFVSPLLVNAQHSLSLFDRIERSIAQSEPQWILVNKWANPNPQFRVIIFRWQLDTNEILLWMTELPTPEEAAREFYNLASPASGQPLQQCPIGDKFYVLRPGDLLFRKANLVVRLNGGDPSHPAAVPKMHIMTVFAQLIASEVPAEPVRLVSAPAERKDARMHREIAAKALREGRYEEAIEEYKRAIELDAGSAEVHQALGLAYLKLV